MAIISLRPVTQADSIALGVIFCPAIKSMIHGYNPFIVEAGIYAGGYQGPLYPNPTSLTLPDFNPEEFVDIRMIIYQMKTEDDIYEGLGKGNPSISYLNFGHLLGLLDTYARMSYGLNIIKAARELSEDFEFGPLDGEENKFLINFRNNALTLQLPFTDETMYPALSEKPDQYLKAFIDGDKILDPLGLMPLSQQEPFVLGTDKHQPDTNQIDGGSFGFLDSISTMSYYDVPDQLRKLFTEFAKVAKEFEEELKVDVVTGGSCDQTATQNFPLPLDLDARTKVAPANLGSHGQLGLRKGGIIASQILIDSRINPGFPPSPNAHYQTSCKSLDTSEALAVLTGDKEFHQSNVVHAFGNEKEFRSLTELNSVINILPIQCHGISYPLKLEFSPPFPDFDDRFDGARSDVAVIWITFIIVDVILNINRDVATSIKITGDAKIFDPALNADIATINPLYPCERDLFFPFGSIGDVKYNRDGLLWRLDWLDRQFKLTTFSSNRFTWDRNWFDIGLKEQKSVKEKKVFFERPGGRRVKLLTTRGGRVLALDTAVPCEIADSGDPNPSYESTTDFNLDQTVEVGPGNRVVTARLIVQSAYASEGDFILAGIDGVFGPGADPERFPLATKRAAADVSCNIKVEIPTNDDPIIIEKSFEVLAASRRDFSTGIECPT